TQPQDFGRENAKLARAGRERAQLLCFYYLAARPGWPGLGAAKAWWIAHSRAGCRGQKSSLLALRTQGFFTPAPETSGTAPRCGPTWDSFAAAVGRSRCGPRCGRGTRTPPPPGLPTSPSSGPGCSEAAIPVAGRSAG